MNIGTPQPLSSSRQAFHASQRLSGAGNSLSRVRTPIPTDEPVAGTADVPAEEDPRARLFRSRYDQTVSRLDFLFRSPKDSDDAPSPGHLTAATERPPADLPKAPDHPKRTTRTIDEDDYGDDDEEEQEEDGEFDTPDNDSPLKLKAAAVSAAQRLSSQAIQTPPFPPKPHPLEHRGSASSSEHVKSSEDVRKKLQEEKQAAEESAKRHFNTVYYTLENDKRAMLEQQKLDELDRQVENEMSGDHAGNAIGNAAAGAQQGSLSSANLGASSLMLKHLLARIDTKRYLVHAQDSQLRRLISEVRKNRSKWASEEKIGQEELYEAAERVLQELKAMTDHSGPFLQKVNKREAPDYYNIIKSPMDIGSMQKKLKAFQYKSKKEFVDDLYLIWINCLKYNSDPNHPLRRKALIMQKHTDRLVVLIPDIVVRDRADVEAEERRLQHLNDDLEGGEDSEDDMPIKASRGRKAPGKKGKGHSSTTRKAPPAHSEDTPGAETKPGLASLGSSSNFRNNFLRADSDAPLENGFGTPPPGTLTPLGLNGVLHPPPSQADASDAEAGNSVNDLGAEPSEDPDLDDFEYRLWKQETKKARAQVASERHRLFRGDKLNPDEFAILRSKAGMRRFMRQQKHLLYQEGSPLDSVVNEADKGRQALPGETLAEGMEEEEDTYLPEYYDPVSGIPDIDDRLKWEDDEDGYVINRAEECMRVVPRGYFTAPESNVTRKMEANMRQMQETRKVCAKIGIVKQMQIQAQTYQNQFQKYDPQPFLEADIEPHVATDDGPLMADTVCREALKRSVGKIFYHAGFEDFQPSALDAVTDIAANFFTSMIKVVKMYNESTKVKNSRVSIAMGEPTCKPRFTFEETILHALDQNGVEIEALESFARDDFDRLNTKLGVMHDRMKSHLTELLRPALDPQAGADGVGAFNDGSDQFVGGDFAEDIDEDFFGFKELGLDKELGLESLSVPFHLLQNRMHNAYQSQHATVSSSSGIIMEPPPPFEPVTTDNIHNEIGLLQEWFLNRLHDPNHAHNGVLIEDDEKPTKARYPKPRLPPTGKITSPRKRPIREQQQMAKKKRKLEAQGQDANGPPSKLQKVTGKLRLEMPPPRKEIAAIEPEKEDDVPGMMSPESM